jgi:hypothetical protein
MSDLYDRRPFREVRELRSAITANDDLLQKTEAENNKLRADSIMADSALQELVAQNEQLKALNAELLSALKRAHDRMQRYGICVNAVAKAIAKAKERK